MLNIGIIGYGKMGRIRARTLQELNRGVVAKIYDVRPVADAPCPQAATEAEITQDPAIDAVFICTPNDRIVPLTLASLRAGKHVFSEKPPAFTAAEVEEVRRVEAASGKKLMYGFNHRHHGSIIRMKEIVDSGRMGRILWMRGRYGKEVDESYFQGWRADPRRAGGGILLDQGIHMLDLFLHLAGEFDEIHALVSNLLWKMDGLEDNVFAIMRNTQTGVCASLHSTMTQWRYLFSLEVFMEHGALILNGLKTSSGVYGDEDLAIKYNDRHPETGGFEREERVVFDTDTSWATELTHFLDAIEHNRGITLGSSTDALRVMKALDRIYQTGRSPKAERAPT